MKQKKLYIQLVIFTLILALLFGAPSIVQAQEVDPPTQDPQESTGLDDTPENDILVFEPQFFWELPLSQGFKITFNFGISFEVPRQLTLLSEEAFNFILQFRSYIREDALEPTETPVPETSPTPEP
jgi:hypothetical protein